MIPEKEREALMRLTMCAREECGMCKYKDTCGFDFQYELATKNMNILAEALRKTENSSEKPNNCDTCGTPRHLCEYCIAEDRMWTPKTELFAKDINVRSKAIYDKWGNVFDARADIDDEPQTDEHCETCRHKDECEGATYEYKNTEWWCLAYAPIDEPQTDCPWK